MRAQWKNNDHELLIIKKQSEVVVLNLRMECHHYTTLDTFWKIIESDTFRATNVKFSNDKEESMLGRDIIKEITGEDWSDSNYFMICFSNEPNILSQWREYAQAGVSIGMDFTRIQLFSIGLNDKYRKKKSKNMVLPAVPIDVLYVDCKQGQNGEAKRNHENKYDEYEFSSVNDENAVFNYVELKEHYDKKKNESSFTLNSEYLSLIPYIKHGDFREEKESRLIFSISKKDEYKYVEYQSDGNHMKPYVNVKFDIFDKENSECEFIQIGKQVPDEIIKVIEQYIKDANRKSNKIRLGNDHETQPDNNYIYISAGKNQEDIFYGIYAITSKIDKTVKIWCEGHWPIRSIMVGPTINKELIVESIQNYCDNHYWLKYVDVSCSQTPYREKKQGNA